MNETEKVTYARSTEKQKKEELLKLMHQRVFCLPSFIRMYVVLYLLLSRKFENNCSRFEIMFAL